MADVNVKPVLPGFWSDPTICRAGDQLILANSSFEYFPAAPIHVSQDMLVWRHVGHVITRPAQVSLGAGEASSGIYGSTLRFHGGRFWFVTTNVNEGGQLLFTADVPEGPWSDPIAFPTLSGIDPDICWDDHGQCHLTWCDFNAGIRSVVIDPMRGRLLGEPVTLWSGTGGRNPEGPHLYRVGDWWYLLLAEGGTHLGHMVTIARSRSAEGPFDPCPHNPILTHRSLAHSVQGVGHADIVKAPDSQWWAVFHGYRPLGGHPHYHLIGRETFAAKVEWRDAWPQIVEQELDIPEPLGFQDDFSGGMSPRWVVPGDPKRPGEITPLGLLLHACDNAPGQPILTRVTAHNWRSLVALDVSCGTALVQLRIDHQHWYGLEVSSHRVDAIVAIGPARHVKATRSVEDPKSVVVAIAASIEQESTVSVANPPDLVTLDGMVALDGRYISTEVSGGFTGRMIGVQALSGQVLVKNFEFGIEARSPCGG